MLDITRLGCQILRISFKNFEKGSLKKNFSLYVFNKLVPYLNLNNYFRVYENQKELKINLYQIIGENDVKNGL